MSESLLKNKHVQSQNGDALRPGCRVSGGRVEPILSFGRMPLANGFLAEKQFTNEYFFDLEAGFAPESFMFQLLNQPAPERMFHGRYPFFTGSSVRMMEHFERFAHEVMNRLGKHRNPFVLEIGSNDGTLLQNFQNAGVRSLGVDPSDNVANVARAKGIDTLTAFFDDTLAANIVEGHGKADACMAANVMCHIPDLHSVIKGIKKILKPDGFFVFEDPYLGDVLEKISYDQIYDEHVFLFSLQSIRYLFELHGMEVFDVEAQPTHGGSMRYFTGLQGAHKISERVRALQAKELAAGFHEAAVYHQLRKCCEKSKNDLVSLLGRLKREGKRVVGYAATSKSTTVTNYCDITPELVEFIADTTPMKQGLFSPGMHIPIKPVAEFRKNFPDYALLFGWNHRDEIISKETEFAKAGGKWITYVPAVGILNA